MAYESLVTWQLTTDYLRCTPAFNNLPRHDGVILQDEPNNISFATLVYVFTCNTEDSAMRPLRVPLALLRPLRIVPGPLTRRDVHLCLYRVREVSNAHSYEVVHTGSIVRGVYLIPDYSRAGDFFAVDTTDADAFLRLRAIFRPDTWTLT